MASSSQVCTCLTAILSPVRSSNTRLRHLVDCIRKQHPNEKIFTFWDYFRKHWDRNAGLRIDHLLIDPTLVPCLVQAGVDTWVRGRPRASDHAPTWVTLDLTKARLSVNS